MGAYQYEFKAKLYQMAMRHEWDNVMEFCPRCVDLIHPKDALPMLMLVVSCSNKILFYKHSNCPSDSIKNIPTSLDLDSNNLIKPRLDVVKFLMDRNASVDIVTKNGEHFLTEVVKMRNKELIDLLVKYPRFNLNQELYSYPNVADVLDETRDMDFLIHLVKHGYYITNRNKQGLSWYDRCRHSKIFMQGCFNQVITIYEKWLQVIFYRKELGKRKRDDSSDGKRDLFVDDLNHSKDGCYIKYKYYLPLCQAKEYLLKGMKVSSRLVIYEKDIEEFIANSDDLIDVNIIDLMVTRDNNVSVYLI